MAGIEAGPPVGPNFSCAPAVDAGLGTGEQLCEASMPGASGLGDNCTLSEDCLVAPDPNWSCQGVSVYDSYDSSIEIGVSPVSPPAAMAAVRAKVLGG